MNMHVIKLAIQILLHCFLSIPALAAGTYPLRQGVHEWPATGGKLYLVVGTYQDSVTFRRTYNFYLKEVNNDSWNQISVLNKKGNRSSTWESAVGADVTLADGMVVIRRDGTYFIIADKQTKGSYHEKGNIVVTWHKLVQAGNNNPDDPAYQFKPMFTRLYPGSELTIEEILNKEILLSPRN